MYCPKPASAVFVVVCILVSLSVAFVPAPASSESVQSLAWTAHSAIVINSDSSFTAQNGVVSGSGTSADPYVIEGWQIGPLPDGTGIDVRNTSAHFRIRNIYVYSAGLGVQMNGVRNGWVESSLFLNDSVGVAFFDCHSCKVVDSSIQGSEVGILISFSDVSQSGNSFLDNGLNVEVNKRELPWELTWVGAAVCAAILVPLAVIISIVLYFRIKRYPPPGR